MKVSSESLKKWAILVFGGVAIVLMIGVASRHSDSPLDWEGLSIEEVHSPPLKKADWERFNSLALEAASAGEERGFRALGKLLQWNVSYRRGVNLSGVDVGNVFKSTNARDRKNLYEYIEGGGRGVGIVSFENSIFDETAHPLLFLYDLKFDGARFSQETLKRWGRALGGGGLAGTSLRGVDMSWLDLEGVFFNGADVSYTGIRPSYMKTKGDEVDRRFEGCVMDGVEFSGGNLSGMSLRFCDLREAEISAQQLLEVGRSDKGRGLLGSRLPDVDMKGIDISGISFSGVDLSLADFDQRQKDNIEIGR